MKSWLLRRLFLTLWAFGGVLLLTFFLTRFLPGDPFLSEQSLPNESYLRLKSHWGLDKDLLSQFMHYVTSMAKGDLGTSMSYPDRSVKAIITHAFPVSAMLGLCSLCLAIVLGLGSALIAISCKKKNGLDVYLLLTTAAVSIPTFLSGALLQYFCAIEWGWLPVARWGSWEQAVLPAFTLALAPAAFMGRLFFVKLTNELKEPYARFAESKGLSNSSILFKHALRNACAPVLAYLGPLTAHIATGSFIVEKIYAIPGLGQWFVLSVANRDYPVITSLALLYSIILMACLLASDLAAAWANPLHRRALFQGEPA